MDGRAGRRQERARLAVIRKLLSSVEYREGRGAGGQARCAHRGRAGYLVGRRWRLNDRGQAGLSPRQPAAGAGRGGAEADRGAGAAGLYPSEAAKAVGVTPAAVYRHFAGARICWPRWRGRLRHLRGAAGYAYDDGKPSALAAFESTGRAYLAFARKYPGHYKAMFEAGLDLSQHPGLHQVAERARMVLERASARLSEHLPPGRSRRPACFRPISGQ